MNTLNITHGAASKLIAPRRASLDDKITWRVNASLALKRSHCLEAAIWAARFGKQLWSDPILADQFLAAVFGLGDPRLAQAAFAQWSPGQDKLHAAICRGDLACLSQDYEGAVVAYRPAIDAGVANENSIFNFTQALLSQGRFLEGANYWRMRPAHYRHWTIPGLPEVSALSSGQTLLINGEQGLGDVIQLIRYVPALEKMGIRVILNVYTEIQALLSNAPNSENEAIDLGDIDFDGQVQLYDLPGLLYPTGNWDYANQPYLNVDIARIEKWQEKLRPLNGLRIGLVWAGNPSHVNDLQRSAAFDDFLSLAEFSGVTWISLQKGPRERDTTDWEDEFNVISFASEINDLADTAALLKNLDYVITVDTMVAHLAGALGVRGLLLLPEAGLDWRWCPPGAVQRWYPSLTALIRPTTSSWASFIADSVCDAIQTQLPHLCLSASATPVELRPNSIQSTIDTLKRLSLDSAPYTAITKAIEQAKEKWPASGRVWLSCAQLYQRINKPIEAAKAYREAVSRMPRSAEAWSGLARQQASKDMLESIHAYQQRLLLPTDNIDIIWREFAEQCISWRVPYLALFIFNALGEEYSGA